MTAGVTIAAATIVIGAANPVSDAAAGVELASAGASALVLKAAYEISQQLNKDVNGPPAVQYSLRAIASGEYPVYTSGSSLPTCTTHLNPGDVWKYGQTTNPFGRYSDMELTLIGPGVKQFDEFRGTQIQARIAEKSKIYNYYLQNRQLPPGNKIFR